MVKVFGRTENFVHALFASSYAPLSLTPFVILSWSKSLGEPKTLFMLFLPLHVHLSP
jgi:hypothetical protein